MLHNFELAGNRVRLWQRNGESYGHILMKALGYAMFVEKFPNMEIETRVGLRYKPDLVAVKENGKFAFWGECGQNTIRKTVWLLKHSGTENFALFKIGFTIAPLIEQLRREIPEKYRADGRACVVNFVSDIAEITAGKEIEKVLPEWFQKIEIQDFKNKNDKSVC